MKIWTHILLAALFITALWSFSKAAELTNLSLETEFNIHTLVFSGNKYKNYPCKQHDCAFWKKTLQLILMCSALLKDPCDTFLFGLCSSGGNVALQIHLHRFPCQNFEIWNPTDSIFFPLAAKDFRANFKRGHFLISAWCHSSTPAVSHGCFWHSHWKSCRLLCLYIATPSIEWWTVCVCVS